MSKIGKKPIPFKTAKIAIDGNVVSVAGTKASFSHELPAGLSVRIADAALHVELLQDSRKNRMLWGLHRVLLANKVQGAEVGFERKYTIVGLGYKAQAVGRKMTFSLGYTHKIDFELPEGVTVELDKTGQQMVFKSADKLMLGNVCSEVRSFRPPEPYKGTGIIAEGEVILRKAGKTKSS